jgi:hypothetical protein
MIKLIVTDAMQADRRIRRHHEIQRGAGWTAIKKGCWQPAGGNSLVADKCDTHETACGVRLQLEESANFFCGEIVGHWFLLKIQRPTLNIQLAQ